jgi:hypothetical protein
MSVFIYTRAPCTERWALATLLVGAAGVLLLAGILLWKRHVDRFEEDSDVVVVTHPFYGRVHLLAEMSPWVSGMTVSVFGYTRSHPE